MTYPPYRAEPPVDPPKGPRGPEPERAGDPAQLRFIARMRWMMALSGFATVLGIAVVIGVIGYRVFKGEGSAPPDVTELLPKAAKVISTTVSGERIAVVIDTGTGIEVRTFDLKTLKRAGRLKFAPQP